MHEARKRLAAPLVAAVAVAVGSAQAAEPGGQRFRNAPEGHDGAEYRISHAPQGGLYRLKPME